VTFHNPPGVNTGEYGDANCTDEHLWAAAELWRTTGDSPYESYFLAHYAEFHPTATGPQGWADVSNLALWTYVLGGPKDTPAARAIVRDSIAAADQVVARTEGNGYRVSLTKGNYEWGSNGTVANYGMQLLVANAFRPNPKYVNVALDNLHYLLGRNTLSLSFVTQVGEHPYRHPHHRPSAADNNPEPWPGLLSGGPNPGRQDAVATKLPAGLPPAKVYADDEGSYSTNEIAINWNAPLVFLLAASLPSR